MPKRLVFCKTTINASNIKHESRGGVDHIIITSFTLPPDIVMNRGLYPADEVEKSFKTLERTLAPIEHPEVNGQFISATDPVAINEFFVGVWNENVERVADGRIKIDKVINVQKALKDEKGKRLLDRVAGLEDGSDTRPMHTSVGVFLDPEFLDKPRTNAHGEEFDWIARDMFFDHDAILLDSVGAATPKKGVGIGVNKEKVDVEFVSCGMSTDLYVNRIVYNFRTNEHQELSFDQIRENLHDALNRGISDFEKMSWIIAVFDDTFVFETHSGEMFRSVYAIDEDGNLDIQDTRLPVERVVEFRPINQPTNEDEDNTMRDKIIAELKKLGISVNAEVSDDDLMAQYQSALAANTGSDDDDGEDTPDADVLADNKELVQTVKDLTTEIGELKTNAKAVLDKEVDQKIKQIQTNAKYKALNEATLKVMHTTDPEGFETMYVDSIPSFGVGPTTQVASDDEFTVNTKAEDLPE